MTSDFTPKIGIVLGSARETRFGHKVAQWIHDLAAKRPDMSVEMIDLRDFDLPFFNEPASNLWMPSSDEKAVAWQKKLAEFDGFIFVTPEYNHSIPAVLKNALDQAYNEWTKKPAAVVAYGSVGGARAAEHLRGILIELQMVNVRTGVNVGGSEFMKVHPMGSNGEMAEIEAVLLPGASEMLDQLAWWADVTAYGRSKDAEKTAAA